MIGFRGLFGCFGCHGSLSYEVYGLLWVYRVRWVRKHNRIGLTQEPKQTVR